MTSKKKVYGVAVNDADYAVDKVVDGDRITCHYYDTWKNMLYRCYGKGSGNPSYADCTVAKEWLLFSAFRSWMMSQSHEGACLDKDILVPGNRVYGPEFCAFVSIKLNNYLVRPRKRKRKLGVSRNKNGWWYSKCKLWDGTNYSSSHKTESEANADYIRVKTGEIEKIIDEVDDRLGDGLRKHIGVLLSSLEKSPAKAKRYNRGKPELSYLLEFPVAMSGLARVMAKGALKYGKTNWQIGGMEEDEYIDSLLRHLTSYKNDGMFDKESGENHLFHVVANSLMLAEIHGKESIVRGIKSEPPHGVTGPVASEKSEIEPRGMSPGRAESPNMTGADAVPTAEDEAPVQSTHLTIDGISDRQWNWVQEMGWHNKSPLGYLALIASEVGEAVNECRGKIPTPKLGSELADIILRTLDFAKEMKIDIGQEIFDKMEINSANGNHKEREY